MRVMYLPAHFTMSNDEAWQIISEVGAGTLVISASTGLESAYAPVSVSADRQHLYSHLAKANHWWREIRTGDEVLALFVGASAYVSPLYYPSRAENPHVVPTWNYVLVQVRGRALIHDDADWKLEQVRSLTARFEDPHDPPWRVDDMDEDFRSRQISAIIGIEIEVLSVEAKGKLSQNRPLVDRASVEAHLAQGSLAEQITAARMKQLP